MKRLSTSLEMEDEIDLHRKGWIIQRIGWFFLLAVFIAACIGVFGTGPVSNGKIEIDGQVVQYQKFARFGSPVKMTVAARSKAGEIKIIIADSYLKNMKLEGIVPQPDEHTLKGSMVEFIFSATDPFYINFYFKPETSGALETTIAVNDSRFLISHFIYP
jgi:hypothetical protein